MVDSTGAEERVVISESEEEVIPEGDDLMDVTDVCYQIVVTTAAQRGAATLKTVELEPM